MRNNQPCESTKPLDLSLSSGSLGVYEDNSFNEFEWTISAFTVFSWGKSSWRHDSFFRMLSLSLAADFGSLTSLSDIVKNDSTSATHTIVMFKYWEFQQVLVVSIAILI